MAYWFLTLIVLAFVVSAAVCVRVPGSGWVAVMLFAAALGLWWHADHDPEGEAAVLARPRGGPTGLRCYDCGEEIGEGELVRRDVQVGSSYLPGDGDPKHHGRVVRHYGRVDLCGLCDWLRDEWDRRTRNVLLVGAALVFVGWIFNRLLG